MDAFVKRRIIYSLLTLLLITIEYLIEAYLKTGFIRFYVGDYLAAILLYVLFMLVFNTSYKLGLITILIFCYLVEFSQWINILKIFNIPRTRFTDVLLGSTFSWLDMLCYTLGILTVFVMENKVKNKYNKINQF